MTVNLFTVNKSRELDDNSLEKSVLRDAKTIALVIKDLLWTMTMRKSRSDRLYEGILNLLETDGDSIRHKRLAVIGEWDTDRLHKSG